VSGLALRISKYLEENPLKMIKNSQDLKECWQMKLLEYINDSLAKGEMKKINLNDLMQKLSC